MLRSLDPSTALGAFLWAVIVGAAAWVLSTLLTHLLRRTHPTNGKLGVRMDRTMLRYIIHMKTIAIFLLALLVYVSILPGLRALFGTLLASAGVSALVLGFAAKSTLANLISGMALAVYRPFRIGDKVLIDGEYGEVEDITLRHTIVKTWEHKRLVIPNEKIDGMSIINYTILDQTMLCRVEVRISYSSDIEHARKVFTEQALQCPYRETTAEEPWVRVVEHQDVGVVLRVYMWVADVDNAWLGRFWLLENLKNACDREGIEIPLPYRVLVDRTDSDERCGTEAVS
jgi:small-conductance mechanosensitive channel